MILNVMDNVILVIEDEIFTREAIEDILSIVGVKVVTAEDGHEGLLIFRDRWPEITAVILDVNIRGMSSEKVVKELRSLSPDVQIILSSGYNETLVRERFQEEEPIRFLPKPYSVQELLSMVQSLLPE